MVLWWCGRRQGRAVAAVGLEVGGEWRGRVSPGDVADRDAVGLYGDLLVHLLDATVGEGGVPAGASVVGCGSTEVVRRRCGRERTRRGMGESSQKTFASVRDGDDFFFHASAPCEGKCVKRGEGWNPWRLLTKGNMHCTIIIYMYSLRFQFHTVFVCWTITFAGRPLAVRRICFSVPLLPGAAVPADAE
jgi:hypothetical protein